MDIHILRLVLIVAVLCIFFLFLFFLLLQRLTSAVEHIREVLSAIHQEMKSTRR